MQFPVEGENVKNTVITKVCIVIIIMTVLLIISCEIFQLQPAERANPMDPGTRTRSWSEPVNISSNTIDNAYNQAVASDGQGNAVAVWTLSIDGGADNRIWTNSYSSSSGWGTAEQLDEPSLDEAEYPSVNYIGSGKFIAVWEQDDGSYTNIYSRSYNFTDGWGALEVVSGSDTFSYNPDVDFNNTGEGFAVWRKYDDGTGDYDIWGCRYAAGGWQAPEAIRENADENASGSCVSCNDAGDAAAVWKEYDGDSYNVYGAMWTDLEGGWSYRTVLKPDAAGDQRDPAVAMGEQGYGLCLWFEENPDTSNYNVYGTQCDKLTGWSSTATLISSEETVDIVFASVEFDGNGNAAAAWTHLADNDTVYDVCAAKYSISGGWTASTVIDVEASGHSALPNLGFYDEGNCLAAWYQVSPSEFSFWSTLYLPETGWSYPELVSESPEVAIEIGEYPVGLAVDDSGDAFAAWVAYEDAHQYIMASAYRETE